MSSFENRMPVPPQMKFVPSTQMLRKSALDWQLIACEAQSEALLQIAAEHRLQISDIDPRSLCSRAKDVVDSAHEIERQAPVRPLESTLAAIRSLRDVTVKLMDDADSFVERADWRAQFRMSSSLHLLTDLANPAQLPEAEPLVRDSHCLVANASQRCLQAECQQDGTFAMQIKSICNLALELVFIAASNASPKNI
jgi:hypothetical protein